MTKRGNKSNSTSSIWGGRFSGTQDDLMVAVNASIDFDQRLYEQDIAGSEAHARMLAAKGIISAGDADAILSGLSTIRDEISSGAFTFSHALEDIHMNIEARLKTLIGEPAGRLHTARSRNDQVATDLRLWVRQQCDDIDIACKALQLALIDQAEQHADTLMPGYTHLQTAQPVTFGHHLMAYVEMLGRDRGRFRDARQRLNLSPLGAAALAGTSFPIDRHMTASALGFDAPMANSMDAVSARDFAMEYLAAAAITATHLSRLAEEIIIWSSDRFAFIQLSDAFSTGSSIMPQKRNPDAAELVRAKPGRITGAFITMLTVIKGLPMTYGKDMQEDKEPVFDASDHLGLAIAVMEGMIRDMTVNKDAMRSALDAGFATATDLADWLVSALGLPFREAHHITGQVVALAEKKQLRLDQLSLADLQSVHAECDASCLAVLDPAASVMSRKSFGGTAPEQVRAAIAEARKRFS
ncbi:MAG TPA: argininosuccinate lyase [Alphaproteobacteria bacterium]|nr:argininosuccinate lyase [Alphaproteobacteria bacterium]